jgi:hypothetical protein
MNFARTIFGRGLDVVEFLLNTAGLVACWYVAWRLVNAGRGFLSAGGPPPIVLRLLEFNHTAHDIAVVAVSVFTTPGLSGMAADWAGGSLALIVAAILAFSAAEGTWWLLRRIGR